METHHFDVNQVLIKYFQSFVELGSLQSVFLKNERKRIENWELGIFR